jgi:hypothetical protein
VVKRFLRLAFLLMFVIISLPHGFAQGGTPVFVERKLHLEADPPPPGRIPESEPLPQGLILAGAAVVAIAFAVVLVGAIRAWRASNVFGRTYRFPFPETADRRFGGTRSGGFMAVIEPAKNA